MRFIIAVVFLFIALAQCGKHHPHQYCCFSDVNPKGFGPCNKDQFFAYKYLVKEMLAGADCALHSCGDISVNKLNKPFYSEQYTCSKSVMYGGQTKIVDGCVIQCLHVDQIGSPCPEVSDGCLGLTPYG